MSKVADDRISDALIELYKTYFGFDGSHREYRTMFSNLDTANPSVRKYGKQTALNELFCHEICYAVVNSNKVNSFISSSKKSFDGEIQELQTGALSYLVLSKLNTKRWSIPLRSSTLGLSESWAINNRLLLSNLLKEDTKLKRLANRVVYLVTACALDCSGLEYKKFITKYMEM